jgi:hypothetical protein
MVLNWHYTLTFCCFEVKIRVTFFLSKYHGNFTDTLYDEFKIHNIRHEDKHHCYFSKLDRKFRDTLYSEFISHNIRHEHN